MKVLVSNQGTATATSITLQVQLPQDFTYVGSSTLRDGSPVADSSQGSSFPLDETGFTISNLPHSSSTLFTFQARNDSAGGLLSWQGAVFTDETEIRSDNNQQQRFISSSSPGADLSIIKNALVGVVSGAALVYNLDVIVGSTSSPAAATVIDLLPSGVQYVAGSAERDGNPMADDAAGTPFPLDESGLLLADLPPNSTTRIRFLVSVSLESGPLVNQGSVSGPGVDPVPGNNSSEALTEVIASGTPLQPVGNTLRWDSGGALVWDPAAGAAVYFVHRAAAATDYADGSAARLTPFGTLATSYLETDTPAPGQVFFYRVNAGDGMTETDELGSPS